MPTSDILVKTTEGVFSYRVAGVLIENERVLLQHRVDQPEYAFPGGHVNFGEVSEAALAREFREEVNAEVQVARLLWVGENFFPWGEKDCHQLCLYYLVTLCPESAIPRNGSFFARNEDGSPRSDLEFVWVECDQLGKIQLYPGHVIDKLRHLPDGIERFVYSEKG